MRHREDRGGRGGTPFIDALERAIEGGMRVVDPTAAAAGGGPIQLTRDGLLAKVTMDAPAPEDQAQEAAE